MVSLAAFTKSSFSSLNGMAATTGPKIPSRMTFRQHGGFDKVPLAPKLAAARDGLRPFCKARLEITAHTVELAFGDHRAHLRVGIEPRTNLDLLGLIGDAAN